MCRLYCLRANEPTKVECSLVYAQNGLLAQSWRDRQGIDHSDGWGIAYYVGGEVVRERRATAAYECLHFGIAAERIYSEMVMAHVRRATVGGSQVVNTHPFAYGPWSFVHNGTVREFDHLAPMLAAETLPSLRGERRGTTDSEATFLWLLSRLARAGVLPNKPCSDSDIATSVVAQGIIDLDRWTRQAGSDRPTELNLGLSDGRILIATRWHRPLFWEIRHGIQPCEICGIAHVHHGERKDYRAAVVASEPISHEEWQAVPDESMMLFDQSIRPHVVWP